MEHCMIDIYGNVCGMRIRFGYLSTLFSFFCLSGEIGWMVDLIDLLEEPTQRGFFSISRTRREV